MNLTPNSSLSLTATQLAGLLDIADDAIICFDAQMRIVLFNHGAERLFGWSTESALGQPIDLLLPPKAREGHARHVADFMRAGTVARRMGDRRTISAVRRDGVEFPAEASISHLRGEEGSIFTVILRDISERVARERELDAARERAEAAMQAKSLFLANMSHEIRTPLNAVIGMTSLLLNTAIDEEQRDYAETVRASSEALLTIINDILDYSKIEVGKLAIEHHPFDLRRVIEEAMDLISAEAGEKNINLAYFIEDSVPAVLNGDLTRVRQVLVNLLSNAIKFTHRGEVVINVGAVALGDQRHEMHFSVRDTGIGIPAEKHELIFQSFSQGDASTTRKYGGTGLGLAISRRLTEMMGGRMWLESQPGAGSTFHFTIVAEAGGTQLAHNFLQEYSSALAGRRLLIVDDNSTNRRILVKQALLWGMLPSAAASGVEALDFVRHGQAFDVAILDMSMPEMDGLGLALEIRKHRDAGALPLIMLSSVTALRHRDEVTARAAFAAYLNKPIKPSALLSVMLDVLKVEGVADAQAPGLKAPADAERLADRLPLKVLVAEDNTVNQKVVQQILAHLGYRADIVATGGEVLAALERQNYDVILMDVQMPEMDGLEATRRLKLRHGELAPRVIAMTANALLGDRERCLAAGMDDYVAKPVELRDVRDALLRAAPADEHDNATSPHSGPHSEPPLIDMRRVHQLLELQSDAQPRLFADLVAMFIAETPTHLQRIANALDTGALAEAADAAHRYLSSIANLGAMRMHRSCIEIERTARDNDSTAAQIAFNQLRAEFAPVEAALNRLVAG